MFMLGTWEPPFAPMLGLDSTQSESAETGERNLKDQLQRLVVIYHC